MKTRNLSMFLSTVTVVALTACGGGGGDSPSGTTPTSFSAVCSDNSSKTSTVSQADAAAQCPASTVSTIVVNVPVANYLPGTEELAAFTLLNFERRRCGFGLLAQNDKLDNAARGHADWLLKNNSGGHYQVSGTPGFTGVTPEDRAVAAEYAGVGKFQASESEYDTGGSKVGGAVRGIRGLLNAPYHLIGMMRGFRDVGVSVRDMADIGAAVNNRNVLNVDFGYKAADGMQSPGAGNVRTYPCDGSVGINRSLSAESPNPVPGRDLRARPLGSSIGIVGDVGGTLTITSTTMINTTTGIEVVLRPAVTSANDPNSTSSAKYFYTNEGYVAADNELDPKTKYQVNIAGANNGAAFSRSFTFTTSN